jgi:hypothetical protein
VRHAGTDIRKSQYEEEEKGFRIPLTIRLVLDAMNFQFTRQWIAIPAKKTTADALWRSAHPALSKPMIDCASGNACM